MLWGGRCAWESDLEPVPPEDEPLTIGGNPSSFSMVISGAGGKTPFHVPKRCLIP